MEPLKNINFYWLKINAVISMRKKSSNEPNDPQIFFFSRVHILILRKQYMYKNMHANHWN